MDKNHKNNDLAKTDVETVSTDCESVLDRGKGMSWFIASEVAGHGSFPTSDRWTRDNLKSLAKEKPHLARKRKGTKAMEYHISLFSVDTQRSILKGNYGRVEDAPRKYSSEPIVPDFIEEFALIPGYRIQVSAGHGTLNLDQLEPTRHLAFRRKWLSYRGFCEKDLAIVWAKGDSMEPTIHNNDTLVVHTGRNKPADGHIYIFRNGDELFVKRYQSFLSAWRLKSDNPLYDTIDIPKDEQHQFEVVGQVVHIAKDLGD